MCLSGEVSYNNTPKSNNNGTSIMNYDSKIAKALNMNNVSCALMNEKSTVQF